MATAAAAMLAKARREIEDLFFDHDAFSADRAVEFEPRVPIQRRFLERMIAEGIVHEAEPGRYWLDLDAYEEMRRKRFISALWIMALFIVVLIVATAVDQLR